MAKGSSKKPGDPKCRECGGLLEGRPTVRVGGYKWHQECAEKKGRFIPREYREPRAVKEVELPPIVADVVSDTAEPVVG